ncbi:MAG: hypothetical protein WCW67_08385 [Candidatus Margulisiibacteriota bacterium]|jgi:hypothetical protein
MGITRVYHRVMGALGSESSQAKLLKSGQLPNRTILRLAFTSSNNLRLAAWAAINARPEIICGGAQRDEFGVKRLLPDAELVLRQRETEPKTVARVLHYLCSDEARELTYVIDLLSEHSANKQGDIVSELGKINLPLAKRIVAIWQRSRGNKPE